MKVIPTTLPGVLLIEPRVFSDDRGCLFESWSRERYRAAGLPADFVQDNVSESGRGVLRGLHYQHPHAQGKLIQVLEGEVFDVAVDIRRGSHTFAGWFGCTLSRENRRQLFIPPGFAHGFLVLSERALFAYKCTAYYDAAAEHTLLWNDPSIAIEWPAEPALISEKDRSGTPLSTMPPEWLPSLAGSDARSPA